MARRSSSLNYIDSGISREISSQFDDVRKVANNIDSVVTVATQDLTALTQALQEATDFEGITVVQGVVAGWNPTTKVLTVPTVKGDTGSTGLKGDTGSAGAIGSRGPQGLQGVKGDVGPTGVMGPSGSAGSKGDKGDKGDIGADLTIEQIIYNNNGTFTWHFSDESTYTTPDLRGSKGDTGAKGDRGLQGISVHHMKGTSTTELHGKFGVFGEYDTYTFYGDNAETMNLGHFTTRNGLTPEQMAVEGYMTRGVYDLNDNGIVDDSEALGGKSLVQVEQERDDLLDLKLDKAGGTIENDLTVSGNLYVNGTETIVNTETLAVKDNEIVINSGEVGAGVTAGSAGIRVDRGTETDYQFQFDEATDSFKIGQALSLQTVATREDTPLDTGTAVWDSTTSKFVTTRDINVDSIVVSGTVDGRDVSVDGIKLDGIEDNATRDQTAEEIKTLYESNLDTNAYTDAEKLKLDGIEEGATADQTAIEIKTLYESNLDTNVFTDAQLTKLNETETSTQLNSRDTANRNTDNHTDGTENGVYTLAERSKLLGIETGAQVNVDTNLSYTVATRVLASSTGTNVTLPQVATSADGLMIAADKTKLNGIETNAKDDQVASEVPVTASGNLTSTNVQLALEELQSAVDTRVVSNAAVSGNTHTKITYDNKGLVTAGTDLVSADIPNLDWTKITTGKPTTLGDYGITDAAPISHVGAGAASHAAVTTTVNGFMIAADKTKLDGIAAGAQVNVGTNLGQSRNATSYTVTSSTGSNTALAAATTANAGVMVASDKVKLDDVTTVKEW